MEEINRLAERVRRAPIVRMFIDYDGTVADFTPRPGLVLPDPKIVALFERLVQTRNLLPAVISGRPLRDIQALIPAEGVMRAGTYGLELELPGEETLFMADGKQVQDVMQPLRSAWQGLIAGKTQFYLEDKGWAVALHAPSQRTPQDQSLYEAARDALKSHNPNSGQFTMFDDGLMMELAPVQASKARTVGWVLANQSPGAALSIYIGDDARDAQAMEVIQGAGGEAIQVGSRVETCAHYHLATPAEVCAWLNRLTL